MGAKRASELSPRVVQESLSLSLIMVALVELFFSSDMWEYT